MSFGNPKETLHRTSISQFKRKPLAEITNIQGAEELLRTSPPSSISNQPTELVLHRQQELDSCIFSQSRLPQKRRRRQLLPLNVGIAFCNLQIAAEHLGLKTRIVFEKDMDKNQPKDREYIASLEIEKAQAP